MEYGPGAVDGSKVFLNNILPKQGDEMTKDISKFVRKHCRSGCHEVLVGDIEVSLCTITHYCKHIKELSTGKRAQELTVFPGYRPRDASGPAPPPTKGRKKGRKRRRRKVRKCGAFNEYGSEGPLAKRAWAARHGPRGCGRHNRRLHLLRPI